MEAVRFGRTIVCLAAAWFLVHVLFYVGRCQCRFELLYPLAEIVRHFFGWQAGGFFALAIIVGPGGRRARAACSAPILALSTLALLACSHNAALIVRFTLFLLWVLFATAGMRLAISRIVGPRYATWGVAAAAVYAALIPACFLLGLIHGITRSNVAALAIATALPGAILDAGRRLPPGGDFLRRIGHAPSSRCAWSR